MVVNMCVCGVFLLCFCFVCVAHVVPYMLAVEWSSSIRIRILLVCTDSHLPRPLQFRGRSYSMALFQPSSKLTSRPFYAMGDNSCVLRNLHEVLCVKH